MNNAFFVSFLIAHCYIFKVRPESLTAAESLLNGGNAPRPYMLTQLAQNQELKRSSPLQKIFPLLDPNLCQLFLKRNPVVSFTLVHKLPLVTPHGATAVFFFLDVGLHPDNSDRKYSVLHCKDISMEGIKYEIKRIYGIHKI